MRFLEGEKEWRLPGFVYANELVLFGESEEDMKGTVGWMVEVCRRRGLKINEGKSKMMVLNGEEGRERVSEFKYLFWTNQVQMEQNAVGRWRAGGGMQVPLGPWLMSGICSLSVLESCIKHCLYLFLCMTMKQYYVRRRRDLELGLCRWTTSEDC